MNQRNKQIFDSEVEKFFMGARYDWKHIISTYILYKKPHLVNAANTRSDYFNKLFVFA